MRTNPVKSFRELRKAKGLPHSQGDIAQLLGVDQATVSRAERNKTELPKPAELLLERLVAELAQVAA